MRDARPRVLIAPDSFKGTLSAAEAAEAMQRGILRGLPDAGTRLMPVSDGGEGFLDVILPGLHGNIMSAGVSGPLPGQRVTARWGLAEAGALAVIESASAAGLTLIAPGKRDPRVTTTFGLGELISGALGRGARRFLVGIGGTGTNDGGAGMASALGARFLDASRAPLPQGGAALERLSRIVLDDLDVRLRECSFTVATDVTNPLTGPSGASFVFGPQKGADRATAALLDRALSRYGEVLRATLGSDIASLPGSGAAGGLGAALIAFCGAKLVPGIDLVLDAIGFDAALDQADLVMTGEGRIDSQTRSGKALSGILRRAGAKGIPVLAVVGAAEGRESVFTGTGGFAALAAIARGNTPVEDAMRDSARLLEERTAELLSTFVRGRTW